MKVFLTGATGFLGGEIARSLAARGHEVAALAQDASTPARLPGLRVIRGDLFEPETYRADLARFRPDALLHCAWFGVAGAYRNDLRQLNNIAASGTLFQAAIDGGATRLVGVGSQAEYGPKSGRIREDDVAAPTTLYGVAKLATAGALRGMSANGGVGAAWGRVFSLYGPGDRGAWLIPTLIRSFLRGRAPELTRCEQIWEFTHVRDAADALIALLETPDACGVFNIGCGAPTPLRQIVLQLRDRLAPKIEPLFGALPYRPDQVMHLEADTARICAATGWRPKIPIEQGLEETVAAFLAERAAA